MKRKFYCPKCNATLNPNVKIVLAVVTSDTRGLILLSPQPGNYQVFLPEELVLEEGKKLDFYCPACQACLNSTVDDNLAQIAYRSEGGGGGRVDFSRIAGEHATYFVSQDEIRSFGENAGIYGARNFFGSGEGE